MTKFVCAIDSGRVGGIALRCITITNIRFKFKTKTMNSREIFRIRIDPDCVLQRFRQTVIFRTWFVKFAHRLKCILSHSEGVGVSSEEHTSELQSLMRTSYAFLCLKK